MTDITPNQWTILESLAHGATSLESLRAVQQLVIDLIERGLAERCEVYLGRGPNMIRLTAAGCALLEIETSSVPAFREQPLTICEALRPKPRKHNRTAEAKALLADIEAWCTKSQTAETAIGHRLFLHPGFVGLLRKRMTVSPEKEQAVREFMTEHPFGWRGELPITHANGTRPVKRPSKGRPLPVTSPDIQPVHRDPCPMCGTRGDIGCRHREAA